MSQSLVSIIIPVYNVEKYLKRAIQCIRQQTYLNLEIILVNDGSTDSSGYICEQESCNDKRIVVVHKENEGSAAARNTGVSIAQGEYLFFLDSDDSIDLDTIATMLKTMEEEKCDLVVCGMLFKYVNSEGIIYHEQSVILERGGEYRPVELLCLFRSDNEDERSNVESSVNKLYKRSMFIADKKMFPEDMRLTEDAYFLVDFLSQCQSVYYLKKAFYHYYRYSDSVRETLTNNYRESRFDVYKKLYLKLYHAICKMGFKTDLLRCKHNFADRAILSCIMLCRTDSVYTEGEIKAKLQDIVWDQSVIEAMMHYQRKPNNSWTVPLLIKKKNVDYLFYFARKIAKRRYAK